MSPFRPMACYWSVCGDRYPGQTDEASPFDFAARVETAAAAGFVGMGFVHHDLESVRKRIGFKEMRAICEANGIVDVEVEILTDWFAGGERRRASDIMRRDLLAAGEALGARDVKVSGDMGGVAWLHEVMVEEFGKLCDDFGRIGLLVGIEIMPWANLSTIANTMAIVEPGGRNNGGVLIDAWHMFRGGIDIAEIGRLPASRIISVELNDAAAEPIGDPWNDTLHHRLPCGEGSFDLAGFMGEIRKSGYRGPLAVEILSAVHRNKPLEEAVRLSFGSLQPFLR